MRAGAQCGEGRGLKPEKKNSFTNYITPYGNYDIDYLGHAYTVYGKCTWGLEIWSQQTSKSIFNKRKTV